eukprot:scaffold5883_cov76-Cylindrotheca_fusiformis.AAC.1
MMFKIKMMFLFKVKTIGVFPARCKLEQAGRIVSSTKEQWDYILKIVWLKTRCYKSGPWTVQPLAASQRMKSWWTMFDLQKIR